MQIIEIMILLVTTICWGMQIWASHRQRFVKNIEHVLIAALLAMLLLHFLMEGYRWMSIPIYILLLLVIANYLFRNKNRQLTRLRSVLFSILIVFATALAWAASAILPVFHFEKPSGQYAVGVIDYTWTDSSRTLNNGDARKLNVRIWYPAASPSKLPVSYIPSPDAFIGALEQQYGTWLKLLKDYRLVHIPASYAPSFSVQASPAPVVVYLHGNHLGTGFTGTFQALELASHGYIVMAVEHPGTAFISAFSEKEYVLFHNDFQDLAESFSAHNAAAIPIINEQQTDVEFTLHYLLNIKEYEPDSPLSQQMDSNRIAIMGHSFGGATAANMLVHSPIIKAAINLDGYLYGEYPATPKNKPLLIINGGLQLEELEETMTDLEVERKLREQLLAAGGIELELPEAGHLSFTDLPLYSPLLMPLAPNIKEQHRLINQHTLQFLHQHL